MMYALPWGWLCPRQPHLFHAHQRHCRPASHKRSPLRAINAHIHAQAVKYTTARLRMRRYLASGCRFARALRHQGCYNVRLWVL